MGRTADQRYGRSGHVIWKSRCRSRSNRTGGQIDLSSCCSRHRRPGPRVCITGCRLGGDRRRRRLWLWRRRDEERGRGELRRRLDAGLVGHLSAASLLPAPSARRRLTPSPSLPSARIAPAPPSAHAPAPPPPPPPPSLPAACERSSGVAIAAVSRPVPSRAHSFPLT